MSQAFAIIALFDFLATVTRLARTKFTIFRRQQALAASRQRHRDRVRDQNACGKAFSLHLPGGTFGKLW